jgi:hypothetical protein
MNEGDLLLFIGPGRMVCIEFFLEQDAAFIRRMNISPAAKSRETSRKAVVPPKRLVMFSNAMSLCSTATLPVQPEVFP